MIDIDRATAAAAFIGSWLFSFEKTIKEFDTIMGPINARAIRLVSIICASPSR
jgi:hypothetical protein